MPVEMGSFGELRCPLKRESLLRCTQQKGSFNNGTYVMRPFVKIFSPLVHYLVHI